MLIEVNTGATGLSGATRVAALPGLKLLQVFTHQVLGVVGARPDNESGGRRSALR